jgi:ATP-dependent helicase/nuclease subunit A
MPRCWRDAALLADYQALVTERGRSTVTNWLGAAFSKRVELQLAEREGVLAGSMPDASSVGPEFAGLAHPVEHLETLRPMLQRLAPLLGAGKNKTMQTAGSAIERALSHETDLQRCYAAIREALFTATGTPRKHLGEAPELQHCHQALDAWCGRWPSTRPGSSIRRWRGCRACCWPNTRH